MSSVLGINPAVVPFRGPGQQRFVPNHPYNPAFILAPSKTTAPPLTQSAPAEEAPESPTAQAAEATAAASAETVNTVA